MASNLDNGGALETFDDSGNFLGEMAANATAFTASEIEQQIATARRFPRSIKRFRDEALEMATLTESIAESCLYAVPRGKDFIEGPSVRFAEIVLSAWGNSRAGARIIGEDDRFITAQGVYFDLQRNSAITYETRRRITGRNGKKFNDDMVGVTGNAACSIALRNAILRGIPKAFWNDLYLAARQTAMGDVKTLSRRRGEMLEYFSKMGVQNEKVLARVSAAGVEDITLENLVQLKGIAAAIKANELSIEAAFDFDDSGKPRAGAKVGPSSLNEQIAELQRREAEAASKAREAENAATNAEPDPMGGPADGPTDAEGRPINGGKSTGKKRQETLIDNGPTPEQQARDLA